MYEDHQVTGSVASLMRKIATVYGTDSLSRQYSLFLTSHPFRHIDVAGVRWPYIVAGRGKETLLLLPGATGRVEASFEYVRVFERDFTVVSVGYPAEMSTVEECLEGLASILDAADIRRACVVGGSYSGLLAQSFVRRYPGRVSKLVLSDTGVPRAERARKHRRYIALLHLLPMFAVRALWRLGAHLYLREMQADNRLFWRQYFAHLRKSITRRECINRLRAWVDFDSKGSFTPHDLDAWPGSVLILEAEHDTTFPAWERRALRKLYPQARVRTFAGGGHAASLDRREEYIEAIGEFALQGKATEELVS